MSFVNPDLTFGGSPARALSSMISNARARDANDGDTIARIGALKEAFIEAMDQITAMDDLAVAPDNYAGYVFRKLAAMLGLVTDFGTARKRKR